MHPLTRLPHPPLLNLLMQFMTAALLFGCADWVGLMYDQANVGTLTALFFVFVLLAATQVRLCCAFRAQGCALSWVW